MENPQQIVVKPSNGNHQTLKVVTHDTMETKTHYVKKWFQDKTTAQSE